MSCQLRGLCRHYSDHLFLCFKQSRGVCWTLILLTWRIWWASNNASKWKMGFSLAFRGLIINMHYTEWNLTKLSTYSEHCTESDAVEKGSFIPGVYFCGFSLGNFVWYRSKYSKVLLLIYNADSVCVVLYWRWIWVSKCTNSFCNRKKVIFLFILQYVIDFVTSVVKFYDFFLPWCRDVKKVS